MTDQHPITPPPELVEQWHVEAMKGFRTNGVYEQDIATQAAHWGADQQLNADCEWLTDQCLHLDGSYLRAAMRPKSPSLKEQALAVLDDVRAIDATHYNILRNALEQLDD